MSYTIEEIKYDLINCDVKQFYMKHIVRSDNWYFENILNIPQDKIITAVDDFKIIVSEAMGISYNSIMMVGSGKTGCSLSPTKHLKQFTIEPTAENKSDIDIAIIVKNEMDDATKERFIRWSAELDLRYDRVFSIIDIQEENMEKWGNVLPFYHNIQKEGRILWKAE